MGFLQRVLGPRNQLADADEWVVVDLETTGLSPRLDRVVEIGLVRVTADGRELNGVSRVSTTTETSAEASMSNRRSRLAPW